LLFSHNFMNKTAMSETVSNLRMEVHQLAEAAFHRHLISGFGDSEYPDSYQIVYEGKPKHLTLNHARAFLSRLMQQPV